MKYIIYKDPNTLSPLPVIFSKLVTHIKMANLLGLNRSDIISAGFISKYGECSGESITLKSESRGIVDSEIIELAYRIL